MTSKKLLSEIEQLAVSDRIELVDSIWASIAADTEPLPADVRAELQRRIKKYGDSMAGIRWEDLRKRLQAKRSHETAPDHHSTRSTKGNRGSSRLVRGKANRPR